jgi:glutamine---fructose-6-phosphate transaminase (isomerizing)
MNQNSTYAEIKSQPRAWQNALDAIHGQVDRIKAITRAYDRVVFTGCGSTYYLSLAAAALYQSLTGTTARAVPGGELLLNPSTGLDAGSRTLLVAVSRSGTTTETVKAVEKFKQSQRGEVVVISNYDADLSAFADLSLIIPDGQEESVAQTRSFASMYVAATAFSALSAGRDDLVEAMSALPKAGLRLMDQYEELAQNRGENLAFDRFYFLGSGILYGLACEVNLKMKEMTLTHSEPFHFLEFRHGPMSMVTESTMIVGLMSDRNREYESAVLSEMQAKGGTILDVAESNARVTFRSGIPEYIRGVLYLPVLQLLACYRSLAKGLNPDRPNALTAVVHLDL